MLELSKLVPTSLAVESCHYGVDLAQRTVLFWDILRQRGNNFIEHERQGLPPVLHFDYEMIMDGRQFERPVNYALLRILPPPGVSIDPRRRPYVIIDPRGGHGPGIGGFKADSQVGVALQGGHPVYFVIFFPHPEAGQTIADISQAECEFVRHVRALHPEAPKPGVVGNCQAGWASMMLAAGNPEAVGPVLIIGAPMSYWGGAWSEGAGDNPMRYAGGLLGGTWLASLCADLGAGVFDGAWLVQNFENLNPANTFCDKYYKVLANIEGEAQRFLEFERWWGGYYLLNGGEIEWITQKLFVGNNLWSGAVEGDSQALDVRNITSPIVVFASAGDNITPPQQAFNWVSDVFGSTEEIKARGQVIVGLMHEDVGHLGIFVSGKVANKEGQQLASVLEAIEALPPGLYGMQIHTLAGEAARYEVSLEPLRLEEVSARLNRYQRQDEKPFQVAAEIASVNQQLYERFARPWVKALATPQSAELGRMWHPLRSQRWLLSDLNPWLGWLPSAATAVRAQRQPLPPKTALHAVEAQGAEMLSALLDGYKSLRDAWSEAYFFTLYGCLLAAGEDGQPAVMPEVQPAPRELPVVKQALARIEMGGYAQALARVAYLLGHRDEPLPLSRLQLAQELITDYQDWLPGLPADELRRIGGEQELIARFAPTRAIATLPVLLRDPQDRQRLLALLQQVLADPRVQSTPPSRQQRAMLKRINAVLDSDVLGQGTRQQPAVVEEVEG
ncbi:poly(3-hydroxybutyrate) depolymerase [Pokkaliibacter plantistimulans]|uniref:Poly(3-hydroxybutyrate) depolymerase n=1 Tax=Pokkaliibacter plantistimulans TaxID=1635171 RepID=A0ABX5LSE3_9GAMM|nr:poly(3-hydroxybutyrate) depolymerase [Pokkaliibacter plantistimulans]